MTLLERFEAKFIPEPNSGCWLWLGGLTSKGYGQFCVGPKRVVRAHRWAYEQFVRPIPDGLQIDHLCRVRSCVNPDHLEPVTSRENVMRGVGVTAVYAAKTHCPNGHSYNGDNLYVWGGRRYCRRCKVENARRSRHRLARLRKGILV